MHPIAKTVSALVYGGDIDQAERALVNVADEEGDRALAREARSARERTWRKRDCRAM